MVASRQGVSKRLDGSRAHEDEHPADGGDPEDPVRGPRRLSRGPEPGGRPLGSEEYVFTAPKGGPLRRVRGARNHTSEKPAETVVPIR